MKQNYGLRILTSLALLLIAAASTLALRNPGLTGICLAGSYLTFNRARKVSNLEGKTDSIKILNSLTPNLVEFSGLTLTAFFSPQILVTVAAIGLVGFTECFRSQLDRKISKNGFSFITQQERTLILGGVFLLSFLNVYWMFYGLILISGLVLADLVYSLYQMTRN
ncbi:hypothetical protein [Candidatus Nanohalobium constans]|uniref:hypothetical protein n=1 Tax=Candidatus Nanohalobium constans TaxID=2565781 RepID=UPI0012984EDE|nr:hypothetical protein [Candidatus Nanohalobium constans]